MTLKRSIAGALVAAVLIAAQDRSAAQRADVLRIRATSDADIRTWDAYVTARERAGDLRALSADRDPALPGRIIERLQQFHDGVPIWGTDVVRDSENGVTRSLFGELSPALTIPANPQLTAIQAQERAIATGGADATLLRGPELTIFRTENGDYRLAYTAVVGAATAIRRVFLDANTGAAISSLSEIQTESAIGTGHGVVGDTKKISVSAEAGTFYADDKLRPPVLTTYDMRNDNAHATRVLNGAPLFPSDRATDSDNVWTDPPAIDAHTYIGWTYDFYFKRFGRRGLDNRDRPVLAMINPLSQQSWLVDPGIAVNAFWCNDCGPGAVGMMFFGNGVPPGVSLGGHNYTYFAGALDIVAHELTHGVTSSTSNLIYFGESGALNEAFSDIMGTSVEFFYQTPGAGPGKADYLLGEDVSRSLTGGSDGDRSLANPQLFGQPDNYRNFVRTLADNGGVHTNSGIANNAFYLAIEGGTNRTSGLNVQGVGAANRAQIENAFYRAFAFLMPSNGTFSTARATTIQAARDLYGTGSTVERAITQAWTAVGVN
jgi:thermolysin